MRERAGLTMEEAAARLEKTRTAVSRIESGESRVDIHLARSIMDLYDDWNDDLLEQVREAMKPRWFRAYGVEDHGYVDVETEASVVCEFAGLNLPGLLQTEPYMRALLKTGRRRTLKELDNDVAVRRIRQKRLTSDDDPLGLRVVVDEAALHRKIGGAKIMRDQLDHMVLVAELPSVTLQVLPLDSGPHDAMNGSFALLEFPQSDDPQLLFIEYITGSLHIENADELRKARLVFDQLRAQALGPAESIELISELARR
ncbi:Putative DNA-binding protein in cluster with Type I restriction-modification system [Alloactinosynnema sp. L-07]|nr:Putative DNA-binding protein in cluster with Type I restriction-modification system [Alloactinosynnema sp. L-07]